MAIRDKALKALRRVFGDERDEREQAESPSADALQHAPSSTYAIWGREDIGGLLSVSQNLMDRFADYEAMNDYPDIRCFTSDMKVYVVSDRHIITPMTIKDLAASNETFDILGFDPKTKALVPVAAEHPRISGRNAPVIRLELSNGESLRVTPDHKILCVEPRPGYVEAKELKKGAFIVGARAGFETNNKSMLTINQAGGVWLAEDPVPDSFVPEVYDITTSTHNLLVNGVICHNSAFHYFANDATQPNMDNGRVCWVQSPDQAVVDMADTLIKRRLRLEDDLFSMAYTLSQYGNCLPASTKVWLEDSVEEIANITIGDRVVLYADGEAVTAPVLAVHNNGVKTVFRLRTKHREIVATSEHPFLVDGPNGPSWKTLEKLQKGDGVFICTQSPPNGEPFPLARLAPEVSETAFVSLTEAGQQELESRRDFWARSGRRGELLRKHGLPNVWGRIRSGSYGVRLGVLQNLFADIGLELEEDHWQPSGGRGGRGVSDLTLPENITPEFCRFYGYAIADGWITDHELNKAVGVSVGDKPEHANHYLRLAQSFAPRSYLTEDDGVFKLHIGSAAMAGLFKRLGWVNGAHEKRLPGWIWGLPDAHREAMLQGVSDGDGHTTKTSTDNYTRVSIELCNRALVEDIKTLVDGLGYKCGNVRYRKRSGVASYNRDGKPIYAGESWTITYYDARLPQPFAVERITSIEEAGEEEVFDLTIDHPQHNFIADGVVVHNCYEEVLVTENGVVGLNNLASPTMRRVEKLNGSLIGYVQDVTGRFTANQDELRRMLAGALTIPRHVALFEDWQVCHFRLRSTTRRSPYGVSVGEGARWIWKRLVMLEDAVMIYKLTRSPARYAFYVDVTDVPPNRVESFLKRAKRDLKKKKMANPNNNFLDMRYNPLANDEDFFIAVRDGRALSRVEVLSGPDYQNTDDVEYFQRKLHGALMVPRAYMGQDAPIQGRAILSNEDIRAARVSLQIQKELKNGVERLIRTDLAARRHPAPWAIDLDVMMTVPSNIYELAAMEVKNARADFAARVQPYVSMRWLLENVFRLSDDEIREIEKQRQREANLADAMGMDPSFAPFTGGRPPDNMGAPPEGGAPGGEGLQEVPGGAGGGLQEVPGAGLQEVPGTGLEEVPPGPSAPRSEWKTYDRRRRLEERRYRESRQNHQKLVDMIGSLQENDASFAQRLDETTSFLKEFKDAALKRANGRLVAVPSAGAGRPSTRFGDTRR